ncbi:hypothetical protein QFC20_007856 [Naganishia adeliensis]|uniref:Uncharacterized protein n=1 Tax=Naganishia adeliensis TaxID=92952 RepID=A0ACC2UV05_9TREE|nr:hypothetical protein QFC20_007856 [Naganishia adeliensis]
MTDPSHDAPCSLPQALASQALTHIVAHSLRSAGFTSSSTRALQTLSAALELYLSQLASESVSNAQDACGRRVPGWEDVLAVLQDFSGLGDVPDVKRMVEKEIAVTNGRIGLAGRQQQAGLSHILQSRARRWRETNGKIGLEMNEDDAEGWLERDEEERRRKQAARATESEMLSRLPGLEVAPRREARERERGHVKGLAALRANNQQGMPTREEIAARPVLQSITLPPPDRCVVRTRSPSPELEPDEEPVLSTAIDEKIKNEVVSPDASPRGIKRRRDSLEEPARHIPNARILETTEFVHPVLHTDVRQLAQGEWTLGQDEEAYIHDAPFLPPLPGKAKHEHGMEEDTWDDDEEGDEPIPRTNTSAAIIDSARRTALEIYTSGAIPYEQSTLSIAYDVSHLTAMEWRKPRTTVPPTLPSVVPSLVKAYQAAKVDVLKAPPSKSSRSFKIAAADALSATVGHPLLHSLAGTTHQVPGLASTGATLRGNPFVPSYPIWAKTELPVNEAHERDKKEKEVYPVKPLPRETAPLGPTVALNLVPSPAMFNPRHPELLRTLITEMAGHPLVDQSTRSGWLRPSALREFTTLQPPEALKVDAAAAAGSGGELQVGQPYLYGDAVRAPGQLGSMDAKIRAVKAKDRKLKAAQKAADGTRKLKISFAGASVAKNEAESLVEQLEAEEQLLKDQDEILLRATWPIDEERGDFATLMEPLEPQGNKKIIASGIGKRLSDILPPAPPQPTTNGGYPPDGNSSRPSGPHLVFKYKRPGEVTPIDESPPPPSASLDPTPADREAQQQQSLSENRSLKFKLKLPTAGV